MKTARVCKVNYEYFYIQWDRDPDWIERVKFPDSRVCPTAAAKAAKDRIAWAYEFVRRRNDIEVEAAL